MKDIYFRHVYRDKYSEDKYQCNLCEAVISGSAREVHKLAHGFPAYTENKEFDMDNMDKRYFICFFARSSRYSDGPGYYMNRNHRKLYTYLEAIAEAKKLAVAEPDNTYYVAKLRAKLDLTQITVTEL